MYLNHRLFTNSINTFNYIGFHVLYFYLLNLTLVGLFDIAFIGLLNMTDIEILSFPLVRLFVYTDK